MKSRSQVANDVAGLFFGKSNTVLNVIQKLTSVNFFKNEVESIRLFEIFNQLDDVFVTSTMVKGFDLFKNPRSSMSRHLVNNFDGKFLIGPNIPTGSDRGIGTWKI